MTGWDWLTPFGYRWERRTDFLAATLDEPRWMLFATHRPLLAFAVRESEMTAESVRHAFERLGVAAA